MARNEKTWFITYEYHSGKQGRPSKHVCWFSDKAKAESTAKKWAFAGRYPQVRNVVLTNIDPRGK